MPSGIFCACGSAPLFAGGFFWLVVFFAVLFFGAAFSAVGFFAAAFFAGIGMVMPGMCICANAGAGREASANALTATYKLIFTGDLQREASPPSAATPPLIATGYLGLCPLCIEI